MKFKGFNITIEHKDLVDEVMKKEFQTLNELKTTMKKHTRGTKEHTLLLKQLKAIRFSLSNKHFRVFQVLIKQKENYFYNCYIEYPSAKDIKDTLHTFKEKLRQKRNRYNHIKTNKKSILGYNYETVGGVFSKANAILTIQNNTDNMARIQTPKVPAKEFKSNYIGVELELFCKMDRNTLLKKFVESKLAGYVYVKDDGSIRTENNYYPHEITILCKQDSVKEIIPKIIGVLRAKDCDASVNGTCGMHIHIDARNRDPYVVYDRLVRALPLLTQLVPKDRIGNRYCVTNDNPKLGAYYRDGLVENGPIAHREERYKAINPMSVASHKTIEVRLHGGTVNSKKIINWIDICTSIADTEYEGQITIPENFFWSIKKDTPLLEYMNERVNLFNKGAIVDTKHDFVMDVVAGF